MRIPERTTSERQADPLQPECRVHSGHRTKSTSVQAALHPPSLGAQRTPAPRRPDPRAPPAGRPEGRCRRAGSPGAQPLSPPPARPGTPAGQTRLIRVSPLVGAVRLRRQLAGSAPRKPGLGRELRLTWAAPSRSGPEGRAQPPARARPPRLPVLACYLVFCHWPGRPVSGCRGRAGGVGGGRGRSHGAWNFLRVRTGGAGRTGRRELWSAVPRRVPAEAPRGLQVP